MEIVFTPDPGIAIDEYPELPRRPRNAEGHQLAHTIDPVSRALLNSVDWGDCWLWMGATNGVGYGQMSVDGRPTYVHRAVYEHCRGPIPEGLVLDHLCRTTLCFRPDHLDPVTVQTNVLRALRDPVTHCTNGHAWTPATTYFTRAGHRQCRRCKADRERARRLRLRGSY